MQFPLHTALLSSLFFIQATSALPQGGTTTCITNPWASTPTSTSTLISSSTPSIMTEPSVPELEPRATTPRVKTLALCCCCIAKAPYTFDEPQPTPSHYMGECSKAGTQDVCGSNYTGSSGFAMEGLEGHPDRIGARCSVSRCGAMRFVD
ncbi:hypothetical protein F5B22DRAFT_108471 [Xylaria bambusicola]|uniref:uncharacterized protein n=1 Tax=Xylaria bambusicola TaxID=326684 RepID=UPI00200884AE|nr:uncharacterized protein F5B22DRAFT_108471 [Xylaria bambusicola]KAI0517524.1 hypothetical protein F5B22DRAFT_108471 [Xylaria bambusicola]